MDPFDKVRQDQMAMLETKCFSLGRERSFHGRKRNALALRLLDLDLKIEIRGKTFFPSASPMAEKVIDWPIYASVSVGRKSCIRSALRRHSSRKTTERLFESLQGGQSSESALGWFLSFA